MEGVEIILPPSVRFFTPNAVSAASSHCVVSAKNSLWIMHVPTRTIVDYIGWQKAVAVQAVHFDLVSYFAKDSGWDSEGVVSSVEVPKNLFIFKALENRKIVLYHCKPRQDVCCHGVHTHDITSMVTTTRYCVSGR